MTAEPQRIEVPESYQDVIIEVQIASLRHQLGITLHELPFLQNCSRHATRIDSRLRQQHKQQ